jgi:hypothetical protein
MKVTDPGPLTGHPTMKMFVVMPSGIGLLVLKKFTIFAQFFL